MKTKSGIHVYEPGEQPELPPGLPSTTDVESSFGFKIVKDGQGLKWAAASEQDFRSSEAERLGLRPDQIEITMVCTQQGPTQCYGNCNGSMCVLVYNPKNAYYYCACR